MKFLALVVSGLFSSLVLAQSSVLVEPSLNSKTEIQSPWSVEAQYNTTSNSSQATFGPSLFYAVDDINFAGARVLAPTGYGDSGTTSVMAVWRHLFSERRTNLFSEVSLAENYYSNFDDSVLAAMSLGTNVGVIHKLTEDISFGGIAGFEWTNTYIHRDYASQNSGLYIYSRLALFAALNF